MQNRDTSSTNYHEWPSVGFVIIRGIHVPGFRLGGPVFMLGLILLAILGTVPLHAADPSDPVLDLLLQKGIVPEAEVQKTRPEPERIRTNELANWMPPLESKWKINKAIKNVELFGDLRLRYEYRQANTPAFGRLELDRARYAVRLGLRGDVFDDFYYGFRLDTAANPR